MDMAQNTGRARLGMVQVQALVQVQVEMRRNDARV